jgi:hypothetical protein
MAALAYFLISQRWQSQAPMQQAQQQVMQAPAQPAPAQAQPQAAQASRPVQQSEAEEPDPPVPDPLPPMPSDDKLLILINTALIALNQANATGNYTVLRDMAAPEFKRVNSPERLAQIFTNLRGRNLDLSPVILFQPKLYRKPEMNAKGMLRITGFFPTAPEIVKFNLIFQPVRGTWRLYGIAAGTEPAPRARAMPPPEEKSATKPVAAQEAKPSSPAKKPKSVEAQGSQAKSSFDVRDRIDNPPAVPAPPEKPKPRSSWNPFSR